MQASKTYLQYDLPKHRIAQYPVGLTGARSEARLLRVQQSRDVAAVAKLEDQHFVDLPELLQPGDLLVLNDTKVLPSRFIVSVDSKPAELFLIQFQERYAPNRECWVALARPMRKFLNGVEFELGPDLHARVVGRGADLKTLSIELEVRGGSSSVVEAISSSGGMPIPPYIRGGKAEACDKELYQTVFASVPGSVAAPTAGLHFTEDVLKRCAGRGIEHVFLTLHVGPASFLPVTTDDLAQHPMPEEHYHISAETVTAIRRCKAAGGRLVAVGTTCVRALEQAALVQPDIFSAGGTREIPADGVSSSTTLLISPGFTFNAVDALLTNFHQPLSTHLLLVAAFAGEDVIASVYAHALAHGYRFLSYGDTMLLERCR